MDLKETALKTKELADLLCISVQEVWEKHTDESVRKNFSLEEVLNEIATYKKKSEL